MSDLCTVLAGTRLLLQQTRQERSPTAAAAQNRCRSFVIQPQPLYMLVWALQFMCLPSAQGDFDTWAGRVCKLDYLRAVRPAQEGVDQQQQHSFSQHHQALTGDSDLPADLFVANMWSPNCKHTKQLCTLVASGTVQLSLEHLVMSQQPIKFSEFVNHSEPAAAWRRHPPSVAVTNSNCNTHEQYGAFRSAFNQPSTPATHATSLCAAQ